MEDNGWTNVLVTAEIITAGRAASLLTASHVTRTRRTHQVTACALYELQCEAYSKYHEDTIKKLQNDESTLLLSFASWKKEQLKFPTFLFWNTVLDLELDVFMFIKALRLSDFCLYVNALITLVPIIFAFDHTHYSRYLPIHIKDMKELPKKFHKLKKKLWMGTLQQRRVNELFQQLRRTKTTSKTMEG